MSELTQEDLEALERIRRFRGKQERIPEAERFPISHPDKYAFPPGLDENGDPFPEEARNS